MSVFFFDNTRLALRLWPCGFLGFLGVESVPHVPIIMYEQSGNSLKVTQATYLLWKVVAHSAHARSKR